MGYVHEQKTHFWKVKFVLFKTGNITRQDDTLSPPSRQRSPNLSLNRSGSDRVSKRSSLSLDLNANEDQLSDNSRSDSFEEGTCLTLCVRAFVYVSIY